MPRPSYYADAQEKRTKRTEGKRADENRPSNREIRVRPSDAQSENKTETEKREYQKPRDNAKSNRRSLKKNEHTKNEEHSRKSHNKERRKKSLEDSQRHRRSSDNKITQPKQPKYATEPEPKLKSKPPPARPEDSGQHLQWDVLMFYVILGYVMGLALVLLGYYVYPRRASRDLNGRWCFIVFIVLSLLIVGYIRAARKGGAEATR